MAKIYDRINLNNKSIRRYIYYDKSNGFRKFGVIGVGLKVVFVCMIGIISVHGIKHMLLIIVIHILVLVLKEVERMKLLEDIKMIHQQHG